MKSTRDYGVARRLEKLFDLQEKLKEDEVKTFESTELSAKKYIVAKRKLLEIDPRLGSHNGGFSTVQAVWSYNTDTGSPRRRKMLKTSCLDDFSKQRELMRSIPSESLDRFSATYDDLSTGAHYGEVDPSECSLMDVRFGQRRFPTAYSISLFVDYTQGLKDIHAAGFVYGDFKGPNCLVNPAKLTDFGTLRKEPKEDERYKLVFSAKYAAFFMWDSAQDQIQNKGRHSRISDLFSVGRSLQYNIIIPILRDASSQQKSNTATKLLNEMEPQPDLIEDPETYDHKNGLRIVSGWNPFARKYKYLEFLPREALQKKALEALDCLKENMVGKEQQALKGLIQLAFDLQNPNPAEIPSAGEVQERLEGLKVKTEQTVASTHLT